MKTAIEHVSYRSEFRLIGGESWEIYCLVDTHDNPVSRNSPIKIKDRHGKVSCLPWGTQVLVIEKE